MGDVKVATFEIDSQKAEMAVQRMNKLMQLMNTTAEDARKQLSQIFVDVHGQMGAPLDQNKKKVEENAVSLQHFRQEQRLNNFVMREGSQSLMSLVFAYSYLNQQQDKAPGAAKKVADSLITGFMAANALQFAFFTLGQMGEKMGGKVGGALQKISSYGGEIAIVVGTVVAARQAFEELMKLSDRYGQRELKFYGERTPKLSLESLLAERSKVEKEIKSIVSSSPIKSMAGAVMTGDYTAFSVAVANEQKLYDLRSREKIINDSIDERSKKNLGTLEAINIQIADAVAKRDVESTTVEDIAAWNEKIVKLEEEKGRLLKTNVERRRAEMGMIFSLKEAQAANVTNEYDKQRYEAAVENQKKLFQIEEDRKKAVKEGMSRREAADIAHKQKAEADLTLNNKILKTEYDQQNSLALLKAENQKEEEDRVEGRYKAEEKMIQKNLNLGVYTKEEAEERFYALRRKREQDLADLQVKTLGELAQGFQSIEAGLTSIGVKADSTLSRMIQMAQVALKIAQLVTSMNAKPQGAETSDYMNIFGSILGFVGLFDSGGWTGPGARSQVAGLVHSDEVVFEQPLVKRNRSELLALRKSLQMGVPMSAAFPGSDNGNLSTAILVSEIRSLKGAVQAMQIQQPIVLRGLLNTQKMVREELPAAKVFMSKKFLDPQ